LEIVFGYSVSKVKPGVENAAKVAAGFIPLAGIVLAPPGVDNDLLKVIYMPEYL
jgi:hypothetical protein